MTQIQRAREAIKLLGLSESVEDYSIDPEMRIYKIALVLRTDLHPQLGINEMGLILSVPMKPARQKFGDIHNTH